MLFLIDLNLPRALSKWLAARGHQCEYALDLQLGQVKDQEIWRRARDHGAVIITKDEDFADMARHPSGGPSVVWLRIGNVRKRQLLAYLEPLWPAVEARLAAGDRLVEVR